MRSTLPVFAALLLCAPQEPAADPGLSIFFIDTEGGAATLIVTPERESVLIDAGNPGGRDAGRITRVAKDVAGLRRIDHLVITHWHVDHFGGAEELSSLIPIARFYDHGPTVEPKDFEKEFAWYRKLFDGKRTILAPGDAVPLRRSPGSPPLRLRCLAAHRSVVHAKESPPAGCEAHPHKPDDLSDNAASLAFLLTYGSFRFLDCGDLSWNIEHALACPENRIGPVDVYQVTHHGLAVSNNPALVRAVAPRVAIMNNGARKGGDAEVLKTLKECPGLEAWYQLHRSARVGAEAQAPRERIANWNETCDGRWIRLDVAPDSRSYAVTVGDTVKAERFDTK